MAIWTSRTATTSTHEDENEREKNSSPVLPSGNALTSVPSGRGLLHLWGLVTASAASGHGHGAVSASSHCSRCHCVG